MKQKTAMQELIEKINQLASLDAVINPLGCVYELATRLLHEEKEQIIKAYRRGKIDQLENSENYYSQTYKNDNND